MGINSIVHGDLITTAKSGKYGAIVHCANCFCVMGAGIAPQIAAAFPEARIADNNTRAGDRNKLGSFSSAYNKKFDLWVLNLYGQYSTGGRSAGVPDVSYDALYKGFTALNKYYKDWDCIIGLPQLGAGLAGGNWNIISKIINETTPDLDLELVIFLPKSV